MLSSILGRETYERYHNTVSEQMRAKIRDHGSNFTWEEFYNHPVVVKCRLETLGAVAQAFEHFEQRMNWFINVMEGSQHNPEDGSGTMPFTEHQAKDFLLAMFGECIDMNQQKINALENLLPERRRTDIAHLISKLTQMD